MENHIKTSRSTPMELVPKVHGTTQGAGVVPVPPLYGGTGTTPHSPLLQDGTTDKRPADRMQPSNGQNGATSATSANSFEGSKELTVKKSGVVPFNWNRSRSGTAPEPLVQLSPAFLHTEMGKKTLDQLFGVGAWGRIDSLVSYGQVRIYGGAPGGGKSVVEKALRRSLRTPPQTDDDGLADLID